MTERMSLFTKYMYTPGSESFGNGVQSARRAGYKGNENTLTQTAYKLVRNVKVIKAKAKIQAENEEKLDISREILNQKMRDIVFSPDASNADKTRAASLIGDFNGYKRETAPNAEREQSKRKRTAYEDELLKEFVFKRTTDEARKHIKVVREGA